MKKSLMLPIAVIAVFLAGCELRGLTRSQLYGSEGDAAAPADLAITSPDVSVEPPDAGPEPDARMPSADVATIPPEGIFVTGVVRGVCDNRQVMVGGARSHTCSYPGKGSYSLRIRGVPPGTLVKIAAEVEGYLPSPATTEMVLKPNGNTHDFEFTPATGSCDTVPDAGPCVCNAPSCEPS